MGVKQTFVRKNYGTLYKWTVITGPQNRKKNQNFGSRGNGDVCTGYVYEQVIINGQIERLLYVECGYVN